MDKTAKKQTLMLLRPPPPPIWFSGNAGCVKDTGMPMAYKRYMFVDGVNARPGRILVDWK